ncbi:molybdopterin-guanine dinucleotide biosynthesis protein B [Candidatus Thorarchaeota archaeon]|nr:MAG: molybdopterin-guanine dinucleotide biosynthesis protein B [Candidatus Thorarchaeota archaeon]
MTLIFAISGYSGTGKTALVEELVRLLSAKGYSVATAKSSKHEPGEEEGSDTARHRDAGAITTVFIGGSVGSQSTEKLAVLAEKMKNLTPDYLIVEGMKSSGIPKIWCVGDREYEGDLPPMTKAVVTWEKTGSGTARVPVFQTRQMEGILDIVLRESVELEQLVSRRE